MDFDPLTLILGALAWIAAIGLLALPEIIAHFIL